MWRRSAHTELAGYFHESGDWIGPFYALINKSGEMILNVVYLVNKDVFQTSWRVKKELRGIFGGEEVGHPRMDK